MANPRQKRKQRSSVAKAGISKASKKNLHKVTIKGPAILADNWDKSKTVRQNYAALGLLPTLDPRQTGGLEPETRVPLAIAAASRATVDDLDAAMAAADDDDDESDSDDEPDKDDSKKAEEHKEALKPGMARIVRDEQGNVVSIIVGTADGAEVEEKVHAPDRTGESSDEEDDDDADEAQDKVVKAGKKGDKRAKGKGKGRAAPGGDADEGDATPWGRPMKDWDAAPAVESDFGATEGVAKAKDVRQGIPIFGAGLAVEAKTDVVRALEERASRKTKVIRHTSEFEHKWLVDLVRKHGDDLTAMARDRKGNVWQKTPGELKRAIAKAGGVDKLRAQADSA
ncbi:hypothetical protein JCM3775_006630 [Rhodotorula graminis]